MSKLLTYGCSFSSNISIEPEEIYPYLVAQKLQLELKSYAFPALCNDEIYSRLVGSLDEIENNDVILYQFTFPSRKGFIVDYSHYETSAGFFNDSGKSRNETLKKNPFADQDIVDYLILNADNTQKLLYFTLQRTIKLLKYLQKEKNIKFRVLFINDEYDEYILRMNAQKQPLRTDNKTAYEIQDRFFLDFDKNVVRMDDNSSGIIEYIMANNLTVSEHDSHPGREGHKYLANKILNSFS